VWDELNTTFSTKKPQSFIFDMQTENINTLILDLVKIPNETEWIEFKQNNEDPDKIGEYISALANSAMLHQQQTAYIVWGVDDKKHSIVGTDFKPKLQKIGNQELENYLSCLLSPKIDFRIYELDVYDKKMVLFKIPSASSLPIGFKGVEYIRVGSYKKKLKDHPEKERELWQLFSNHTFEKAIAIEDITTNEVVKLLDYPGYFQITQQNLPDDKIAIIDRLLSEKFIIPRLGDKFDVTNLGAILFAKNLSEFDRLGRKSVRVVFYQGRDRTQTQRELRKEGYAIAFERIIIAIDDRLPQNEHIGRAFRASVKMYPEIAIRELIANALIHQDFSISGTGPIIEVFEDRIEITNPGVPLIDTMRFIDNPPQSRNESLASFMRRINICEERGSGIDKVIKNIEIFQLPAPNFAAIDKFTKSTLFAYQKLNNMSKDDKVRACYQHACLRFVSNDQMTNSSLRERFSIEDKNYSIASRIISDTLEAGLIKPFDPGNTSKRHAKYVPCWA
jgi:ATP-dependent DNA helicase RecG